MKYPPHCPSASHNPNPGHHPCTPRSSHASPCTPTSLHASLPTPHSSHASPHTSHSSHALLSNHPCSHPALVLASAVVLASALVSARPRAYRFPSPHHRVPGPRRTMFSNGKGIEYAIPKQGCHRIVMMSPKSRGSQACPMPYPVPVHPCLSHHTLYFSLKTITLTLTLC